MTDKNSDPYSDIINLPHHVSETRKHMSMHDRAAQFSPFAALTGHDAAIAETARLTDDRTEVDEFTQSEMNRKFELLKENIKSEPEISVTYFRPDERKKGGAYVTLKDRLVKIDMYNFEIRLKNGVKIPIGDISALEIEPEQ